MAFSLFLLASELSKSISDLFGQDQLGAGPYSLLPLPEEEHWKAEVRQVTFHTW